MLLPLGSAEGQALSSAEERGADVTLGALLLIKGHDLFVIEATGGRGHTDFFVPLQLFYMDRYWARQLDPPLSSALVTMVTIAAHVQWASHQSHEDIGSHGFRPVHSSQTHTANVAMLEQDMPN